VGHRRETFVEMLLAALWLYREFPDVDLFVNFSDVLQPCEYRVPFLQYTAITGVRRSNLVGLLANASDVRDPVVGAHVLCSFGSLVRAPSVQLCRHGRGRR
jgi:hypothetical protein